MDAVPIFIAAFVSLVLAAVAIATEIAIGIRRRRPPVRPEPAATGMRR